MKIKQKRQASIKTLKTKLDRVFSIYIRLRDANKQGYCQCISCGAIHHWKDVDCGHYVNRSHMGTRYSQRNCNAQCRKCNRFDEGNNIGYTKGLIKKYGIGIIDLLDTQKHTPTFMKAIDYDISIEHYNAEIKKIENESKS